MTSRNPPRCKTRNPEETAKALEAERRNRLYRELREKGIENHGELDASLEKTDGKRSFGLLRAGYRNARLKKRRWRGPCEPRDFSPGTNWEERTRQLGEIEAKLSALYGRWDEVSEHMRKNFT